MIELGEALLGAVLLTIGAVALVFPFLDRHPRERSAIWFGLFVVCYGLRLMAYSDLLHDSLGGRPATWDAFEAVMTYITPAPLGLFALRMLGPGPRQVLRRAVQTLLAYPVIAITIDLASGRAGAGMVLNEPFVLFAGTVMLVVLASEWRLHGVSQEARVALAGAAVFFLVALVNTLKLTRGVEWNNLVEGFGTFGLIAGLGYMVAVRTVDRDRRLTAINRDLELASEIQRSILPRTFPKLPAIAIAGCYLPMHEVAGDFYDWLPLDGQRCAGIVADVSGHGVPAALIASMVKIAFSSAVAHSEDPGLILENINRALTGKFERAYVTATCVVVDTATGALRYCNAGHPPPLLRRDSGEIEALSAGGVALAFLPESPYSSAEVTLAPGDAVVLFTDGLLEACDANGAFFGDAELGNVIRERGGGADQLSGAIGERLRAWIGPRAALQDDVTVMVLEFAGAAARTRV